MRKSLFIPLFTVLSFFLLSNNINAQTLSVSPIAATCAQNGMLSWAVVGASPTAAIVYTVTNLTTGIPIAVNVSQTTLSGLPPGSYQIDAILTDGGITTVISETEIIVDDFIPLDIDFTTTNEICVGDGNGAITLNVNNGNLSTVEISSGPITFPPQTTPTFMGLVPGVYTILSTDICGIVTSSNVTIINNPPFFPTTFTPFAYTNPINPSADCPAINGCDEMGLNIIRLLPFQNPSLPWTIDVTVTPPASTGQAPFTTTIIQNTGGIDKTICTTIPSYGTETYNYQIDLTDNCGNTIDYLGTVEGACLEYVESFGLGNFGDCGSCFVVRFNNIRGGLTANWTGFPAGFDPTLFTTANVFSLNGTLQSAGFCSDSNQMPPNGTYTVEFTDDCKTVTATFDITAPPSGLSANLVISNPDCNGNSEIRISTTPPLNMATIIAAPSGYAQTLPFDVTSSLSNFGISSSLLDLDGLAPGSYTFLLKDNCGDEIEYLVDVVEPINEFDFVVTPSCGKFSLEINDVSNFTVFTGTEAYTLELFDPITNAWQVVSTLNNLAVNPNICGEGLFRIVRARRQLVIDPCVTTLGEFTYVNGGLDFESVDIVECDDDSFTANLNATGITPITYKIISINGVATLINNGTNSTFTNLAPGLYEFEVEDACGNVFIRTVELTQSAINVIIPDLCYGFNASITAQNSSLFSFEWWNNNDPSNILSTTNTLNFTPLTAADVGFYSVLLNLNTNSACFNEAIVFEIPEITDVPILEAGNTFKKCLKNSSCGPAFEPECIELAQLGAMVVDGCGFVIDAVWSTFGDGSFDNVNFEEATCYTPGPNDIANGTVKFQLSNTNSTDPNTPIHSDCVTIRLIQSRVLSFPANGN